MMHRDHRPQEVQEVGDPWAAGGRGHLEAEEVSSWAEDWTNSSAGSSLNTSPGSPGSLGSGPLHQTIIQGVLVCLFTTVGGVMLLVFCLIIVQECKVTLSTVLYCTVLYCTLLYCTVLYCTVLYCTVLWPECSKWSQNDVIMSNLVQDVCGRNELHGHRRDDAGRITL